MKKLEHTITVREQPDIGRKHQEVGVVLQLAAQPLVNKHFLPLWRPRSPPTQCPEPTVFFSCYFTFKKIFTNEEVLWMYLLEHCPP